jgi:hypothetical protein
MTYGAAQAIDAAGVREAPERAERGVLPGGRFASVAQMRVPKAPTLAAVALATAVLAGCGGGGSDSSASTPTATEATTTLSKAQLISQGDAICAEVNAAVGSVGSSGSSTQDQITQVSSLYTGLVERLKGLGTPDEAAGYSEFIAAAEALAKVEDEAKLAAERGDTAALGEAATRAAPALEEFESAAGAYGFKDCSEEPSAPTVAGTSEGSTGGEEEAAAPESSELEGEAEAEAPEATEEPAPEGGGTSGTEAGGTSGTESGGSTSGGIGPG